MIEIRKSAERGNANWGWLNTFHSFSFGEYYDPKQVQFGPLRVLNEDFISGGGGFPTHPHQNMEIITYVLKGALAHKDSMGNKEVIYENEIQKMTAGSGVFHSEFNNSEDEPVHLFQTWIMPDKNGLTPSYDQKKYSVQERKNLLQLIVSPDKSDSTIHIQQDAKMFISNMAENFSLSYAIENGRSAYLHLIKGALEVNGATISSGDALKITNENSITINSKSESELILFDLKMN